MLPMISETVSEKSLKLDASAFRLFEEASLLLPASLLSVSKFCLLFNSDSD